jgi:hypothetical protein
VEWSKRHEQQDATKVAIMVEPSWMLKDLTSYFADLEESGRHCRLTGPIRRKLLAFFENNLMMFEGYVFEAEGLAEVLDPLLNVFDRVKVHASTFGKRFIQPAPPSLVTIPPNDRNLALYRNGEEPWITKTLRTWFCERITEEGKEYSVDFEGYVTRRQTREGITDFEYPIKRILNHREAADGSIEYLVQWLGYTMPKFDSWVGSAGMDARVHKEYDVANEL